MNADRQIRNGQTPYGRVVTLTFLSPRLQVKSFTEPLAQYLKAETGASVALVRFTDATHSTNFDRRQPLNPLVNGNARLLEQLTPNDAGFHIINLGVSHESHRPGWIALLIDQLRHRFDYILIEAVTEDLEAAWLPEFTGYRLYVRPFFETMMFIILIYSNRRIKLRNLNNKARLNSNRRSASAKENSWMVMTRSSSMWPVPWRCSSAVV